MLFVLWLLLWMCILIIAFKGGELSMNWWFRFKAKREVRQHIDTYKYYSYKPGSDKVLIYKVELYKGNYQPKYKVLNKSYPSVLQNWYPILFKDGKTYEEAVDIIKQQIGKDLKEIQEHIEILPKTMVNSRRSI